MRAAQARVYGRAYDEDSFRLNTRALNTDLNYSYIPTRSAVDFEGKKSARRVFSAGIILLGAIILFIGLIMGLQFPTYVAHKAYQRSCILTPNSTNYNTWVENNFRGEVLNFLYYFNVTNPQEVTDSGAEPETELVGPYVYREFEKKTNVQFDSLQETISFQRVRRQVFDPQLTRIHCGPRCEETDSLSLLNPVRLHVEDMKQAAVWRKLTQVPEVLQRIRVARTPAPYKLLPAPCNSSNVFKTLPTGTPNTAQSRGHEDSDVLALKQVMGDSISGAQSMGSDVGGSPGQVLDKYLSPESQCLLEYATKLAKCDKGGQNGFLPFTPMNAYHNEPIACLRILDGLAEKKNWRASSIQRTRTSDHFLQLSPHCASSLDALISTGLQEEAGVLKALGTECGISFLLIWLDSIITARDGARISMALRILGLRFCEARASCLEAWTSIANGAIYSSGTNCSTQMKQLGARAKRADEEPLMKHALRFDVASALKKLVFDDLASASTAEDEPVAPYVIVEPSELFVTRVQTDFALGFKQTSLMDNIREANPARTFIRGVLEHFNTSDPSELKTLISRAPAFNISTCLDGFTHLNNFRMLGVRNYFEPQVWLGNQGLLYTVPPSGHLRACVSTDPSFPEFDLFFSEFWAPLRVRTPLDSAEEELHEDKAKPGSVLFVEHDPLIPLDIAEFQLNRAEQLPAVGRHLYSASKPSARVYSSRDYLRHHPDILIERQRRSSIPSDLDNWLAVEPISGLILERHTSAVFTSSFRLSNGTEIEIPMHLLEKREMPSLEIETWLYRELQIPLHVSCVGVIAFGITGGVTILLGCVIAAIHKKNRITPFFQTHVYVPSSSATSAASRETQQGTNAQSQSGATPRSQRRQVVTSSLNAHRIHVAPSLHSSS